MSKEFLYAIIAKMHARLNQLIEENNFDLLSSKVLSYSRKLDRAILLYNKLLDRDNKVNQTDKQG